MHLLHEICVCGCWVWQARSPTRFSVREAPPLRASGARISRGAQRRGTPDRAAPHFRAAAVEAVEPAAGDSNPKLPTACVEVLGATMHVLATSYAEWDTARRKCWTAFRLIRKF